MANSIIEKIIKFFNSPIGVRSSSEGKAVYFADEKEENIREVKDYYSMGALGPYTADQQYKFRLQYGDFRIFEVHDKEKFFFDNVDVYPDDDGEQCLGLSDNRWKELHAVDISAGKLNLSDLETAPAGVQTVDLVMDPNTGKIYRKS